MQIPLSHLATIFLKRLGFSPMFKHYLETFSVKSRDYLEMLVQKSNLLFKNKLCD